MKILINFFVLFISIKCVAQNKETTDEYVARLKAMADSIKQAKKSGSNKATSNTGASNARYNASKYSTNKSTIDNAFNFLTAAEKEKVKNYPSVPEAFRTNLDAQEFLNKLKAVDVNADVQKYSKEKSMGLIGFLISFLKTKKTADEIVAESFKLKENFIKNNPSISFGSNVGKTYVGDNSLVYLPLGDASFADVAVAANYVNGNIQFPKENSIGTPNYVLMKNLKDNKGIYSLGLNGSLTIKFTDNALVDVNGPDLFVFEAGEIEPTNIDISKDGKTWINIGKISGGTAALDIKNYVKPTDYFYFVRLTDLNTKSTVAGADIDAVAAIGAAIRLSLSAEVLFDLGKADLKNDGLAAVKKIALQLKEIGKGQVTINGYTDDIGSDDSNNRLSLARAKSVASLLVTELSGSNKFTFITNGKGKESPVEPNTSEENRKKNRRVELIISQ
jgi:outer membrane protein OmpA-like peptidoglycan-associated protein